MQNTSARSRSNLKNIASLCLRLYAKKKSVILNLVRNISCNIQNFARLRFSSTFRTKKRHNPKLCPFLWARRDSNPRPKDYESSALPLRHRPVTTFMYFIFKSRACVSADLAPLGALPTSPRT